jgi:hypothetical protein
MADGYPPNGDRYPGTVPLYAARAVHAAGQAPTLAGVAPAAQPADCAFFLHKALLDPPSLLVSGDGDAAYAGFPVELRRIPSTLQLDRTFAMVAGVEQSLEDGAARTDPAERLVALACLTALYEAAGSDLAFSSDLELSRRALEKGKKAASEGKRLLAGIDWTAPAGRDLLAQLAERFAGRSWHILVLPGGDVPVLRLAAGAARDGFGRTDVLAALIVAPLTRRTALGLVSALPVRAQLDVMHEVFRAYDHQRPWASRYVLDGGDGEFARAYRVFEHLAWALWEAARPQDETLGALLRGAADQRLDRAWLASLVEYYGRNALALQATRAGGATVAKNFARWLEEHGFAELDVHEAALAAGGPT